MTQAEQGLHSPKRGDAERDEEGQPGDAPGHRAFAPTLEHRHQSNCEEQDRDRAKHL